MAASSLVVVAAVLTIFAIAAGGYFLWKETSASTVSYIDALDDQAFGELNWDTPERRVFEKMLAAYEEDSSRVPLGELCSALLRRAMALAADAPCVHLRGYMAERRDFSHLVEVLEGRVFHRGTVHVLALQCAGCAIILRKIRSFPARFGY